MDVVLITCSTRNRAYREVERALGPRGVPVVQFARPMMEAAVARGGRALVVATHGPTVASTQALLKETAEEMGREIAFRGAEVEAAWERLAAGDVAGRNGAGPHDPQALAEDRALLGGAGAALLAALLFSYPEPERAFGVPVYTSAECGFRRVREVLAERPRPA